MKYELKEQNFFLRLKKLNPDGKTFKWFIFPDLNHANAQRHIDDGWVPMNLARIG